MEKAERQEWHHDLRVLMTRVQEKARVDLQRVRKLREVLPKLRRWNENVNRHIHCDEVNEVVQGLAAYTEEKTEENVTVLCSEIVDGGRLVMKRDLDHELRTRFSEKNPTTNLDFDAECYNDARRGNFKFVRSSRPWNPHSHGRTYTLIHQAVFHDKKEVVAKILHNQGDVNAKTLREDNLSGLLKGSSPLTLACHLGRKSIVNTLLAYSAKIDDAKDIDFSVNHGVPELGEILKREKEARALYVGKRFVCRVVDHDDRPETRVSHSTFSDLQVQIHSSTNRLVHFMDCSCWVQEDEPTMIKLRERASDRTYVVTQVDWAA